MKKINSVILYLNAVLILLTYNSVCSQVKQEWAAIYNGTGNSYDGGFSVAVDRPGNVYVTGTSTKRESGEDITTIKYNSSGVQQWIAFYNGTVSLNDRGVSVAADDSGNVYVTGTSTGSGALEDIVTIKYSSSGDSVWVRRFNGEGDSVDIANAVAVDGSGNVCVSGSSIGKGTTYDYTAIKYSPSGEQLWAARYNGPGNGIDWVFSMTADSSGNVYLTGGSLGKRTFYDYATIKYSPSGKMLWTARYDAEKYNDEATAIAVDGSGNVYVTGSSNSDFGFFQKMIGMDFATVKYSPDGRLKWVKRYNSRENKQDVSKALAVDDSDNVYVAGLSGLGFGGLPVVSDLVIIKYNKAGDEIWKTEYSVSENSHETAEAMALDNSGNVIITGFSFYHYENYLTIMMNSSGRTVWSKIYNGSSGGSDISKSVAVDDSGNVYVTGESDNVGSGSDIVTIKYSK